MRDRVDLAKHFAELGFTKGAEVGVDFAYYSRVLLDHIPDLKLLCVDSWQRNPRAYDIALGVLSRYPNAKMVRQSSLDAAQGVPDESLDFVFIDADHVYHSVKADIEAWVPKVKHGGVVSGHNYEVSPTGNSGVIQAVDEYVAEHQLDLKIIPRDKSNPYQDDRHPCWYLEV